MPNTLPARRINFDAPPAEPLLVTQTAQIAPDHATALLPNRPRTLEDVTRRTLVDTGMRNEYRRLGIGTDRLSQNVLAQQEPEETEQVDSPQPQGRRYALDDLLRSVAPQQSRLPEIPRYQALDQKQRTGFKGRMMGLLEGLAAAGTTGQTDPAHIIGAMVGGAFNRDVPRSQMFQAGPQAQALRQRQIMLEQQAAEQKMNDARAATIARLIQAHAAMQRAENGDKPITGGEILLRRNPETGEFEPVLVNGEAVQSASAANNQRTNATREKLGMAGITSREKVANQNNATRMSIAGQNNQTRVNVAREATGRAKALEDLRYQHRGSLKAADLAARTPGSAEPTDAEVNDYMKSYGIEDRARAITDLRLMKQSQGAQQQYPNAKSVADKMAERFGTNWGTLPSSK